MASVRGRTTHNLRFVFAAAALALAATALAEPPAPNSALAIEADAIESAPADAPQASAPLPAPRPSAAAPANAVKPRPLGPKPEARPLFSKAAADQSAAAAVWGNPIVRTGGSLAIVLLLIVVLAAFSRKLAARSGGLASQFGPGGKAPEGLLEVLGRYPLFRGQTLILLKLDSRILLLSQTTPRIRGGVGTLTTLSEITDPEEVASILVKAGEHAGDAHSARFTSLLRKFDRTHDQHLPDHTEIEIKGRRIHQTVAGDRAEMLDDQAIAAPAAAGIYQPPQHTPAPAPAVIHKFPHPTDLPTPSTDSFNAIRQRLHALHGEAHR
jgi:flagellar biogenesis protein FliO